MSDTDWAFFDIPASQVQTTINTMASRADEAASSTYAVIEALGNLSFDDQDTGNKPVWDFVPADLPPIAAPEPPSDSLSFGEVYSPRTPTPYGAWAQLGVNESDFGLEFDDFNPKSPTMSVVPEPAPLDTSGMPVRGDFGDVVIPSDIVIAEPVMGAILPIEIPDFEFPLIQEFVADIPVFDEPRPNTNVVFSEAPYSSVNLTAIQSKVREWLQGGTGLPAAVEQALFDRARAREQETSEEAISGAFDAWAARGFSMPPGMLVEQVNVAQEKSRQAQNALSREILIKAKEWEIENLRVAVERGIALESALLRSYGEAAQRAFEAAKYRVEADISLYNAMVSAFNAKMSGLNVQATVYKVRTEAELQRLEQYKAMLEGERTKSSINELTVRVYESQIKAVGSKIENQRLRMEGAKTQAEIIKSRIDAFRADMEGYSSKISAGKARFDAYEAQLRGEAAKASSLEAEANAYAATIRASEAKANVKVKYVEAKTAAMNADISAYNAQVQLESARVQSSSATITAAAQAYTADISRYGEELRRVNDDRSRQLQINELNARNAIAVFETQMKQYDSSLSRVIERMRLAQDALKAAGQYSAAMAQGAMSAIHVSAGMSAGGSASSTSSNGYSVSHNHNYQHEG